MDTKKLKDKILNLGMNVEGVARSIGVDKSSFYRKLNDGEKFTVGEARRIKNVLSLSDEEVKEFFLL
ncbi:MAG: XRE family transcriptional regulator [Clostridia bacterium]|nr:XRE family transcriptional regulator [Clostridia bacterium]